MEMKPELIIDIASIALALFALLRTVSARRFFGGRIRSAMTLFTLALLCFIAAFAWTLIYERFELAIVPYPIEYYEISMHHLLFLFGLVFFMFSAQKLSGLART